MKYKNLFLVTSFALRDISKSRIVLSLVIVSLSVAFTAVFAAAGIMDGFKQTLTNGAVESIGHLLITPGSDNLTIDNIESVTNELAAVENIESFSVRSYAIAGINYKGKFLNPYRVIGFDLDDEGETSKLTQRVIDGRFTLLNESDGVVLGLGLADGLEGLSFDKEKIKIGEEIQVTTINGNQKNYFVRGIIDAKAFNPNWFLILPKKELENLDSYQKNSEIIIKLKDANLLEETKQVIQEKDLGVRVVTWREEAGYIDDILSAVSFITGLINRLLTISVFVIMSIILFINVFQKRRQIGIIKSMGATNSFVVSIYMLETLIYVIFSYILGFLFFLLIHRYSINNPVPLLIGDFHTELRISNIIVPFVMLLFAAVGGSFIPAYLAAKTKIVDVLRGNI